ncbi:MAG: diaminopimelate decarboxylase [Deltaproteobacteria bacterium]|jgi:diaminopimelate decarboxylase|nr:diaminopimelate decarboxylase [Deltaproteobacteria bacterium]MCK5010629.1 diaminopimelate decarboxylase [Deltaproteobacteria bacterium]NOQ85418.1 diaminopimelate decarboxylase [Deltaproteobacteria bacterium]
MHDFQYHQNELYCEEVPINKIADKVGTPFYLYSNHTLENHFKVFDSAFNGIDHLTCFSVKANSNLTVLKIFVNLGGGVDIVSGGELFRALNSGVDPSKVVFSGVGKGIKELEYALEAGILMFNVESTQELTTINQVAQRIGRKAKIALRVNPHIDPQTHPYISTGLKKNKFGIEINQALEDYREAKKLKHIEIVGVDCHIGSQITELQPFVETLRKVKELVLTLRQEAIEIQYVDLGGGLGITYHQEQPPHPREYASALIKEMQDINCTLILEPGRVIAGNAGILVTKVLYLKKGTEKTFVTVDAAMNDLIRPSLYGAFQGIQPIVKTEGEEMVADIVGPICESGDFLAKERTIPCLKPGDLIAVMSAGAYGFTMSSNYNSRPRVPEVLAREKEFYVIRERESYEDLIRGEMIPEFLNK